MKHPLLALTLFVVCVSSCKEHYLPEEHPYSSFMDNKMLRGKAVLLDSAIFTTPYRVAVKDSVLLVLDNANDCCHAFTYPEGKFLVSFGESGSPSVLTNPDVAIIPQKMLRFHSLDSIWLLKGNDMELVRWRLSPSEQLAEPVETVKLDKKLVRALDFYPADSNFWFADYTGKYRYHRVDYTGKCRDSHGRIPTRRFYKDGDSPTVAKGWSNYMDFHPQNGLLVMASRYGETIELYNVLDGTFKMLIGPNQYPKFHISGEDAVPSGIIGFNDVQVTQSHIFTIFEDRLFQELKHARIQGISPERGGRYIYVFNLDGVPVCKYTLDHAIVGFHVDETTGMILAADMNGEGAIVKYQLE